MASDTKQAYTVAEAAKMLDTTPTTVTRWANEDKLVWSEIVGGKIKLITAESVDAKLRTRRVLEGSINV
jgi:hypothetical protein